MRTDLVGREDELRRMVRIGDDDGPRAVVLAGAAGVGKSRLLDEVVKSIERTSSAVIRLYGSPSLREIPLGAVSHLVPAEASGDLTTFFAQVRSELWRIAADRPLVVAVDDAHELDEGSASLVQQLLLHGEARVVMTIRAEATPSPTITDIWMHDGADRLDVEPLPRDATARLATALLGGDIEPRLESEVWRLSRGHPLYVTVALDAARDHRAVRLRNDVWRIEGELSSERLSELVVSRTRDLDDTELRALRAVALGEPLREDDLAGLVDGDVVERLTARALVTAVHLDGRRHLTTQHPVYADVLTEQLTDDVRRTLAGELAAAVLARGPATGVDRLRASLWTLEAGREPDPRLAVDGAEEAMRRGDYLLAERICRAALAADPAVVRAQILLGRALGFQGRGAEAEDVLSEVDAVDQPDLAELALAHGHVLGFVLGRPDEGIAVLSEAARRVDEPLRWQLDADRALYGAIAGRFTETFDAATAALENPRTPESAQLTAYVNLVLAQAMTGRLDDLDEHAEAGLELATRRPGPFPFAPEQIAVSRASGWCAMGRIDEAARACRERIADAERIGAPNPLSESWLGICLTLRGDIDAAVRAIERALAAHAMADPFRLEPQTRGLLQWCRAHRGTVEVGALDELADAERAAGGETRLSVWIGRGRAWVTAACGDVAGGADLAARAGRDALSHDHLCWGVWALHDAVRFGHADAVVDDMVRAVDSTSSASLLETMRDHAVALATGDAESLGESVSQRFASAGATLLAGEAVAQASALLEAAGDLTDARRYAVRAEHLVRRCTARTPATERIPAALTERELQVAEQAAAGLSSRRIADRLFVSVRTVDNHLSSVYRKLDMRGRDELIALLA